MDYSVIIPVYNCFDQLLCCLNSIPESEQIQIILVDDNSDNDIELYLKQKNEYKKNLTVVRNNRGKGAGAARNLGLSLAKGKWIIFADADDTFVDEAFSVFGLYKESDYDLIYFAPCSKFSDTNKPAERHIYYKSLIDGFSLDDIDSVNRLRYQFGVPWCKMIKKDLITQHSINFDEVRYSNDVMFSVKIGHWAKNVLAVPRVTYCVTVTYGSLVNQISKESLQCRYEVLLRKNAFIRSVGKKEYQVSIIHYLRLSIKYGILFFFKFVRMGIAADANFFIGYQTWIKSLFSLSWMKTPNKKYIVKNM